MRGLVALSFVKEMAEKDGVYKTKGDLCRFQLTTNSVEKGSWFMSNSGATAEMVKQRITRRSSCWLCCRALKREMDSVNAIGSMEVGLICEESSVLELDEHAEELQKCV